MEQGDVFSATAGMAVDAGEVAQGAGVDVSLIAATSTLVWSMVYFTSKRFLPALKTYRSWDRERQYKARCLVPSTIFLIGIVTASIAVMLFDQGLQKVRVVGATDASLALIATAAGYFLYDSILIAYHFESDGAAFLAHGVLCFFTYALAASFRVYNFYGPVFLLFESTTLFINARWLLYELGLRDSTAYMVNGLLLFVAWFAVRIVFGYGASYYFFSDTLEAFGNKALPNFIVGWYTFANIGLNLLNTMWFFKIFQGVYKAVFKKSTVVDE
mmetsp:Transcript_25750/g.61173  ORF Transcript_25750/g.61173 Transcript_25750/m.61173 type:complete len:272 (+) Transcript_25750:61-876(+)